MFLEIPVSFSVHFTDAIVAILQKEAIKHSLCIDYRCAEKLTKGDHQVIVRVLSFGDFGIQLRAYAWSTSPNNGFDLKCDLNKSIKESGKRGIEFGRPVYEYLNNK